MVNCANIALFEGEDDQDVLWFNSVLENDDEIHTHEFQENNCNLQGSKKRSLYAPLEQYHYVKKAKVLYLLSHDIRKSYALMISHVLNSGSFPMLYGFLDTFCDQNIEFTKVLKTSIGEKVHSLRLRNVKELTKFFYAIMKLSPDNVTRVTAPHMQYTTGKVICNFEMESTYLYDAPTDVGYFAPHLVLDGSYGKHIPFVADNVTKEFVVGQTLNCLSDAELRVSKLQQMSNVQSCIDRVIDVLPLRLNPTRAAAKGNLIFLTDENKRITKIDVSIVIV